MKTTTRKAVWSIYGLCLVMLAYACRNEDAMPLKPFTFETLRNLRLPTLLAATPAPVIVTPSSLTISAQADQVRAGIASIPSSGQVPGTVSVAAGDMSGALASAGVVSTALIANFTPQVITTLTTQGTLPGSLQTTINTLVANPVLQPYLTKFTLPTVNGQTVGPMTKSITGPGAVTPIIEPVVIKPINYAGTDACFKAANDLFDQTIVNLESQRLGQVATANADYNQQKAAAESDVPGCVSGTVAKYSTLATTAKQNLDASIASLNAARQILGDTNYNVLVALTYVLYTQQLQTYYTLQTADINTCTITSDAKTAASKFARDTDINFINRGFNATIRQAQAIVLALYDSCHNQGSAQ